MAESPRTPPARATRKRAAAPTRQQLAERVAELEALCADLLVAAVETGLPQPLMNRLWAVVRPGTAPVPSEDLALPPAGPQEASAGLDVLDSPVERRTAPAPVPDIRLTASSNPSSAAAPAGAPATELRPLAVRKTALVVDDDPMMLGVLGRILERENLLLIKAASGPDAIRALDDHPGHVDLLITDYAMPGMQGRELADRVRQRFPSVKVLYQTGFSDLLFQDCAELEEGAAFLEKPFTARGLREAARLVLFGTLNPS